MPKILLVDDEPVILESLSYSLDREGFEVQVASDGAQALDLFNSSKPDLVILDIRLPEIDGLEVCRRLRAISPVPILMLTALGNELDRVVGLEVGADDYLPKPFSFRELLARIRSILRRVELDQQVSKQKIYICGNLRADLSSRRVFKGDKEVQLSAREFELLTLLISQAGRAVSRDEIIRQVWGIDWSGDPRTIEVHIRWLRLKIEDDPTLPHYVQTVRGYGYRFACTEEVA
ncbi:MAG: response regulator transcription factor [Chloroflexi bacterium]|nr:response regulator transcription factor [Chloroflexota bacterium]